MRNYFIPVLLAVVAVSCERDVAVDVPAHEGRLVVNAQWQQDSLYTARITKSRGILDDQPRNGRADVVNNALVVVLENNIAIDTLRFQPQREWYQSRNRRPVPGRTYGIKVTAPSLPDATASSQMLMPIKPKQVTVQRRARRNADGQWQGKITIVLQDPAEKNFYLFRIRNAGYSGSCVATNDPDIEQVGNTGIFGDNSCFEQDALLFADRNFNGREKTIVLFVDDLALEPITISTSPMRVRRSWLETVHVQENFFQYLKALAGYRSVDDFPFAEPVNVPNNVTNGYGFFTAFPAAVDTLR